MLFFEEKHTFGKQFVELPISWPRSNSQTHEEGNGGGGCISDELFRCSSSNTLTVVIRYSMGQVTYANSGRAKGTVRTWATRLWSHSVSMRDSHKQTLGRLLMFSTSVLGRELVPWVTRFSNSYHALEIILGWGVSGGLCWKIKAGSVACSLWKLRGRSKLYFNSVIEWNRRRPSLL